MVSILKRRHGLVSDARAWLCPSESILLPGLYLRGVMKTIVGRRGGFNVTIQADKSWLDLAIAGD